MPSLSILSAAPMPVPQVVPIRPDAPSAVDRVCNQVRAMVLQGRLAGGQAIVELELASALDVARSTVREALGRLEAEGLLARGRSRGVAVRRLSRDDVAAWYELREMLEGFAARRAAERVRTSRTWLRERLAEEKHRWEQARRTGLASPFHDANRGFHALIAQASGNRHLPGLLDSPTMILFTSQFRNWLPAPALATSAEEHLRILSAVMRGEAREAEAAGRRHVRSSAHIVLALADEAFE